MAIDKQKYDLIVVGTGFASSFFLYRYLQTASANARVAVIEKGAKLSHSEWLKTRKGWPGYISDYYQTNNPNKKWYFSLAHGGGSNCWWACTPRFLPNDFRMKTEYGIARDWPVGYDDLELYYSEVENLMQVSGPSEDTPFKRSSPYPQKPHSFNATDKAIKKAYPDSYFIQPTARPVESTSTGRAACCNNNVCNHCPINSKYNISTDMNTVYEDTRVEVFHTTTVKEVITNAGRIEGVVCSKKGDDSYELHADFVALGANAFFNALILQSSGIKHKHLGSNLFEQRSIYVTADLHGMNNFQGSTSITGHGYMFYDGKHRRDRAAILIENYNKPEIRLEYGKWRQRMKLKFVIEELPQLSNSVAYTKNGSTPMVQYGAESEYLTKTAKMVPKLAEELLKSLPVENMHIAEDYDPSEGHILGTAVMGNNPEDSIVDANQLHHTYRNLAVLGGSSFPTGSPANPTLTISALSLWSANNIFG